MTTFSKQYIRGLLPEEYKEEGKARDTAKLSFANEQKSTRKPQTQTSDKEKLDKLYKTIQKSVSTGQGNLSEYIQKAEVLGLDVSNYAEELEEIKQVLNDSVGRQYADVKDDLNDAYKRSTDGKKILTAQISAEEVRIKKSEEDQRESLRDEVTEKVTQQVIEMTEKERLEKLLEEIPDEFSVLREWVRDGFWSIGQILSLLNNPSKKKQLVNILEKAPKKLLEGVKTRKTSLVYANTTVNRLEKHSEEVM